MKRHSQLIFIVQQGISE